MPLLKGQFLIYKNDDTNNVYLLFSSKKLLIQQLKNNQQQYSPSELDDFINLFIPFTDNEIKQHLISLNSNWQKAFDCLDKEEITPIDPTPVGLYIGRRIVKKVINNNTIPLMDFYK